MILFKKPFFQFDFLNLATQKREQINFEKPMKILQTSQVNQVKAILNEVELAVHNGYYAAGFLSYEASEAFLPTNSFSDSDFPLIYFGIFDHPTEVKNTDHHAFEIGKWTPNISKNEYNHAFKEIEEAFKLNETKQVNYTIQLNADFKGDSFAYYKALKNEQNADYSAYLSFDNFKILSLSPELFFDLNKEHLTVKPMKGTKERGKSASEDQNFKHQLQHSTKDKLENQLIVDLMIDELKHISMTDSIKIKKPFDIQTFPTLFQMTSTIEAVTKPHTTLSDIFKALFPCGSITGTPKVETINFINQLEKRNRNIYCGAIGFITPENKATFNVPIRTALIDTHKEQVSFDVGGGITNLSNANDEYNEAYTKAKILELNKKEFELIETFALDNGNYFVFDAHIKRLQASAHYFNFKIDIEKIKTELAHIAELNPNNHLRVRLLLAADGETTISTKPLNHDKNIKTVHIADRPINQDDLFLYHKTTHRFVYDDLKADYPNLFDVILWNDNNEITEFTIGNLVIEYDNALITPPISSGLLPGTFREVLLEEGLVKEAIITKEMLKTAKQIWLINSVRKWVKVTLKKASP